MVNIKKDFGLLLSLVFVFCLVSLVHSQAETQPQPGQDIIVTGRLALEKHGEEEFLLLHAKDTTTYLIKGNLRGKLRDTLIELGQNNLVSLKGNQTGLYGISCRNSYGFDIKGNRKVDSVCIRFYHLEATQILDARKSDEEIPPPKRDAKEEKTAMKMALSQMQMQKQGLIQTVMIEGTVSSINLKSPIKTIEITRQDKDNKVIKNALLLSSDTRVVKLVEKTDKEPMDLNLHSLKIGQKVAVVYSRSELKSEALLITITKE